MPSGGLRNPPGGRPKKPPKSYSDKFKNAMWRALAREAKKQKKTVFELFAERLYTPVGQGQGKIQDTVWASLWKALCEVMAAKESHQTIEDKRSGPVIGLPPIERDGDDTPKVKVKPWAN